jgi:cytosine/adenosine deaminase-related metal-dependent hydrolase
VIHSPISNLRMGSGIMPLRKLKTAGITLGLASDGMACNDTQSMFDVMRFGALLHTVSRSDYRSWPTSREILRMATSGNARCMLAQNEIGSLLPGKRADVILLDLKTINFTPLHNLENQLVFTQPEGSVDTVIVDGEVIVEDGQVLTVDEGALLDEVRTYASMVDRDRREALPLSNRIWPYMDQVYQMAVDKFD